MPNLVSAEVIAAKIFTVREKRVMLDSDLAKLYCVETKHLGLLRNSVFAVIHGGRRPKNLDADKILPLPFRSAQGQGQDDGKWYFATVPI